MSVKNILLTGGSGFIGSHFHDIIPHDQIVNLDLLPPRFDCDSRYIQGDIRIKKDVEKAVIEANPEVIISLAAMHHDFGISEDEYFDTNCNGTKVLCDVASDHGIKTIVFYSSVAVYGSNTTPSSEEMEPNPDMPYGASKLAGEEVLREWALEDSSRNVLIIRPALVFGINNTANMYKLIHQINLGIYFHLGKAENIKSLAYVKNIIDATLFLLGKEMNGFNIYNYADEPHLSSNQIANTISRKLGTKIRLRLPKFLGVMLGLPFDLIIKITGKNLPISSARVKKLATETYHYARKVVDEGFTAEFTTEQGLEKMVEWYQKSKK